MEENDTLVINANIEIPVKALQSIVENFKKAAGYDKKGGCKIDTADKVSEIISIFLQGKDFLDFTKDISNYK